MTPDAHSGTVAAVDSISVILALALIVSLPFWIALFVYEAVRDVLARRRERRELSTTERVERSLRGWREL